MLPHFSSVTSLGVCKFFSFSGKEPGFASNQRQLNKAIFNREDYLAYISWTQYGARYAEKFWCLGHKTC